MVWIIKEKEYFDLTSETKYIMAQNLHDQSPCPTLEQTIHRQRNSRVLPFMCCDSVFNQFLMGNRWSK